MRTRHLFFLTLIFFPLAILVSCGDDEGTTPVEEEEEETTEAPESWVLVDADSFFVASARPLPGGSSPYRYQINFASREQLNQTNNDGETQSTFAIQFAFESRPTTTGSFTFTNDRFSISTGQINLYQSFFVNTGHGREDKNYLSEAGTTVEIDITDGILSSNLGSIVMINEADDTDSFTLKWSLNLNW